MGSMSGFKMSATFRPAFIFSITMYCFCKSLDSITAKCLGTLMWGGRQDSQIEYK